MGRHERHEFANVLQSPHYADLGSPVAAAVGLHVLFGNRVAGEILAREPRLQGSDYRWLALFDQPRWNGQRRSLTAYDALPTPHTADLAGRGADLLGRVLLGGKGLAAPSKRGGSKNSNVACHRDGRDLANSRVRHRIRHNRGRLGTNETRRPTAITPTLDRRHTGSAFSGGRRIQLCTFSRKLP
jgi:hypothetical protein